MSDLDSGTSSEEVGKSEKKSGAVLQGEIKYLKVRFWCGFGSRFFELF